MRELTEFQKQYQQCLIDEEKEELAKHAEQIIAFKKFMSQLGIFLQDENFKYYQTTGIVASYPNIISFLSPNLLPDKEGLLDFKNLCSHFELKDYMNGYLYSDNFMLLASSYFRRGFHHLNNYAPRFVELFWNFHDKNIDSYISLDKDRVRINVDNQMYMELDTWYGAQFKNRIETIADGVVKVRPPLDLDESYISFFFANAYSLDIKWSTKNGIKSFQAEEFKTDKIKTIKDNKEYYPVRYIHAEFDVEQGNFRHFDGAIHFYTADEYFARRDSDFNYNFKNLSQIKTYSEKLFKMNGVVKKETWIEFTSHFFTGNPLIFEYFEGQFPDHIQEMIEKVKHNKANDN